MAVLSDTAREALASGHLAHLTTINRDGGPQVTVVWIGLDGDEIVSGHLNDHLKLRNIRRDPRAVVSVETGGRTGGPGAGLTSIAGGNGGTAALDSGAG